MLVALLVFWALLVLLLVPQPLLWLTRMLSSTFRLAMLSTFVLRLLVRLLQTVQTVQLQRVTLLVRLSQLLMVVARSQRLLPKAFTSLVTVTTRWTACEISLIQAAHSTVSTRLPQVTSSGMDRN